jgi:hypothetical protein
MIKIGSPLKSHGETRIVGTYWRRNTCVVQLFSACIRAIANKIHEEVLPAVAIQTTVSQR